MKIPQDIMLQQARILLFFVLTLARAAVAPPHEETDLNNADGQHKRTLFDILWGCILTTVICAWVAVHPNIPPREGPLKRTLRRLELMFWTIVAPEILPCWALRQLLAAREVRNVYNKRGEASPGNRNSRGIWKIMKRYAANAQEIWKTVKGWVSWDEIPYEKNREWTLRHAHFLIMGGIRVVEPNDGGEQRAGPDVYAQDMTTPWVGETNSDQERLWVGERSRETTLTLDLLKELVKTPGFEIQVTEDDLIDKSKGDSLSKFIFILQTSWFIVHCIARRVQGLSFTQLELSTLALASMNGITIILWWDKPLGAQAPVRVYMKRKLTNKERNAQREFGRRPHRSRLFGDIQKHLRKGLNEVRNIILCRSENNIFVAWLIELPLLILAPLLSPPVMFIMAFIYTGRDLVETHSFPIGATHVPTFYVPDHHYSIWFGLGSHFLLLLILGSVFGGIHCAAWNFPFPTFTEQEVWRVASLAVTITPIVAIVVVVTVLDIPRCRVLVRTSLVVCTVVYMAARVALFGLALALLRSIPPSAFIAVDWTKFYPHI